MITGSRSIKINLHRNCDFIFKYNKSVPRLCPVVSLPIPKVRNLLVTNCDRNQTICNQTVSEKTQFSFQGIYL
jgi:hypothetical protein